MPNLLYHPTYYTVERLAFGSRRDLVQPLSQRSGVGRLSWDTEVECTQRAQQQP